MRFENFGVGDCELVEEFAREILAHLSARNVKQDITCVPYQTSGSRFFVRGEICARLRFLRGWTFRHSARHLHRFGVGHIEAQRGEASPQTQPVSRPVTSAFLKKPSVDQ